MVAQAQPQTLFDKVWASHVVTELSGGVSLLAIDRHLMHDLEAGAIIKLIADRGLRPHNPELTFGVPDHAVATDPRRRANSTPNSERLLREMKEGSDAFGITYFDLDTEGQGIVHVIGPELGLTQPGMTSSAPTAIPARMAGSARCPSASARRKWRTCSRRRRCGSEAARRCASTFDGKPAAGVSAKDIILHRSGRLGAAAGRGHAVEYAGEPSARCRSRSA